MPLSRRVVKPSIGVVVLGAVVLGSVVLWVLARPGGQPNGRYLAEVFGVEAVLLFSCALVLATVLPAIERAFGGLDRVAQWHRHAAVAAVILMVLHAGLVGSSVVPKPSAFGMGLGSAAFAGLLILAVWSLAPSLRAAKWSHLVRRLARISHERWLTGHRLTGLFVAAAVAHGAIVDPVLKASTSLRVAFLVIGGVGVVAYVYRELLARFVIPVYDFTVADVQRPNATTVNVSLEPAGRPLSFEPGQFVFLAFGGVDGWQRHPFSVASAPTEKRLEVSIRSAGDYTQDLHDKLQPGTAKAAGPGFRAMDEGFDRDCILLFGCPESEALYR